jgi:hypothetical protein
MKNAILTHLYDRAVDGLPLLGRPSALVQRMQGDSPEQQVNAILQLYTALCGSTGFLCGLPGYVSMPVTIPANIAGVALLQLHMTASVATIYGHDVHDDATREACVRCVVENSEQTPERDEGHEFSSRIGSKLTERGIRFLSEQTTRLFRTAGRARSLPLVGGLVGGVSDAYATRRVGRAARRAFLDTTPA